MGNRLCVLLCYQIPDDNNLKREKMQGRFCKILKRKKEMETEKKVPNQTLEDWILPSPGLKPDYVIRPGEFSSSCSSKSQKKVHPCVSKVQVPGSLIAEAKDSLCLDRTMNRNEEMLSSTSIGRSISEKSQKKVSFKLPHNVIFYSPDEPRSPEEKEPYYCYYYNSSESEDSFYSSICREYSFDPSADETLIKLAVDVLPHVSVSSKI